MKSSTLRRSNLSKEKMAVLEALSRYKEETSFDNSPSVYVRPNKEKELDILWENFKINQKTSPSVYLATGFVSGAIFMLILTTIISFASKTPDVKVASTTPVKNESVHFIPSSTSTTSSSPETYIVKSGDTVESILIRFYGSYSPERAKEVQRVNKMSNIHKLQIGQKLIMPID